ncbi:MAG: hypothetical protein ACXQTM_08315 [Methanosarcinales archaeon]
MYYKVDAYEGRFNLLNPSEVRVSNRVRIYNNDGSLLKAVSVLDDGPIFDNTDKPEDIAEELEEWLDGMIYTSDEEEIRDMIQFLREHSKELLKGKLHWDIKRIEEKIKELNEKKERLRKQYEKLLAGDEKEIDSKNA